MSYSVKGSSSVQELKSERAWSPSDGYVTIRRIVGEAQAIKDYFEQLVQSNANIGEVQERYNGGYGELIIRSTSNSTDNNQNNSLDNLETTWELATEVFNKPIESHPYFDSLTAEQKIKILTAARSAKPNPETSEKAKELYKCFALQVNEYMTIMLRLTKTTVVNKDTVVVSAYNRVMEVWRVNEILKNTYRQKNTNTGLLGTLKNLPKMYGSTFTKGEWEWVYLGPQIQKIGKNKYHLMQSWLGAERWYKSIYKGGSWDIRNSG